MKRVKYSDIGLSGGNVTDLDSVMQGIHTILHTRVGERIFDRKFGSRIEDYLFEPFNFITTRLILSEILSSITRNDNRVKVISKGTSVNMNYDERKYEVVIAIEIIGLEGVHNFSSDLFPKDKK